MAAANRGECSKSGRLHELLEWPGGWSAVTHRACFRPECEMSLFRIYQCLCLGPGSPKPQQGALLAPRFAILWKYMLSCLHMPVLLFHWSQC